MTRFIRFVCLLLSLCFLICSIASCGLLSDMDKPHGLAASVSDTVDSTPVTTLAVDLGVGSPDYEGLQQRIDEIIQEQLQTGFTVEEILIVFVDEDRILEDGHTVESFARLTIGELEAFHQQPLRLTADGIVEGEKISSEVFSVDEVNGADWNQYLSRMLLGTGILFVGICLSLPSGGTVLCAATTLVGSSLLNAGITATTTFLFSFAAHLHGGMSSDSAAEAALRDAANAGSAEFLSNAIVGALLAPVVKLCFAPNTLVSTPHGAVPIEHIAPGDIVYTRSEEGRVEPQPVLDVLVGQTEELLVLQLEDGQELKATPSHRFFNPVEMEYVPAEELTAGDTLLSESGELVTVTATELCELSDPVTVFNLSTAQNHNYFVLSEEDGEGILVSNSCLHKSWRWVSERRNYWKSQASYYDMHPNYIGQRSLSKTYEVTKDNLDLMRKGRAPFGIDGKRVELHHYLDGGIEKDLYAYEEITATRHRSEYASLHSYLFKPKKG